MEANSTPKLTAEAIAERQRHARICEHGRDAEIRAKAFEEAAEMAHRRAVKYRGTRGPVGHFLDELADDYRALAKEQT